jgi:hypothetical protein
MEEWKSPNIISFQRNSNGRNANTAIADLSQESSFVYFNGQLRIIGALENSESQ